MFISVVRVSGKLFLYKFQWLIAFLLPALVWAQSVKNDSILQSATLENVIRYAIQKNPDLSNALLDERIAETMIKGRLAEWYPQINFNYSFQHNFQLPTANFNNQFIRTGVDNTSGVQFGLMQNIFNRDVLLASRTVQDVRLQAKQNTTNQRINIAVLVSKAFYDVIFTIQQLHVIEEDINRINVSLKDAYYQYQGGVTDKTDYKRATIALNNAKAQKRSGEESLKAKYAYLKELMGYPLGKDFELQYDTTQLKTEIYIDTLQLVNYSNRIEFQLLETQKKLLQYNLAYARWSFLPDLSLFANYNLQYQNNSFSKLYGESFPNSYTGILLSIPIFQGGRRIQQVRQARLQLLQVDNQMTDITNTMNRQYVQALATYKSNLFNYLSQQENVALAREVYDVIQLQYRAGIKTYLEVINSETDLRTAQINLYNALYQVLSSKVEVQQSLGNITY
ncbi:MAG TPA: TolC family protein [Flavitalea sp.]|nr:TolC family protein [Flavitalea sp.]